MNTQDELSLVIELSKIAYEEERAQLRAAIQASQESESYRQSQILAAIEKSKQEYKEKLESLEQEKKRASETFRKEQEMLANLLMPRQSFVPPTQKTTKTVVISNPRVVPNNTKVVNRNPRVVPNNTKVVNSNLRVVPNNTKVVNNNLRIVPNNTKVVNNNPRVVPNNTKVVNNNPRVVPNNTKVVNNNPRVVPRTIGSSKREICFTTRNNGSFSYVNNNGETVKLGNKCFFLALAGALGWDDETICDVIINANRDDNNIVDTEIDEAIIENIAETYNLRIDIYPRYSINNVNCVDKDHLICFGINNPRIVNLACLSNAHYEAFEFV
ncbi:hypothetical protein Hokovirus_1_83 [Hokovirus HKV1]|uniref:OTU domain-containing protein n=1 Tax=Hokovirus HKV1 TaxID=1977638 RepID=A0A1V0SF00_9VIRU|nr:hypothetical protein Hokovirus_1_83 [Hokovirus HKV1]